MTQQITTWFDFAAARRAQLVELNQTMTYEGLLEGLPTKEMNARQLEHFQQRHPDVHLIVPADTPLTYDEVRPYPFGEPSMLPIVRCIARLSGLEEDVLFESEGRIAWFQHDWALPIEEAILASFREIDWVSISSRRER